MPPTATSSATTRAALAVPLAVETGMLKIERRRVETGAFGVCCGEHRGGRAGVDDRADRLAVHGDIGLEMPVDPLPQRDDGAPVAVGDGERAAGDDPAADAARHVLQLVAVFVAGHEDEDHQQPHRQLPHGLAETLSRSEDAARHQRTERAEIDEVAETVGVEAEHLAARNRP